VPRVLHQIPVVDELRGAMPDNDRIQCHWSDCDNPSSNHHRLIECYAAAGVRAGNAPAPGWWLGKHSELPDRPMCAECRIITFCSERCSAWYQRSHLPGLYGKLPPGVNPRYFLT
jgi:hypothetical protein